ncbi:MAG: helix-turn-helix domain-containing protein [Saccharofermentanaceae bacterium]|jgi:transcriptional regulator with PAS, ATPase and Fis domain
MSFTKKTIMVRDDFYERLRRDSFFGHKEIKEIMDGILASWIQDNPEEPHRPAAGRLNESRAAFEVERIKDAMANAMNHRERAAKALGISRMALNMKCRKYGLAFPDYRDRNKKK